ncbi:MAG: hypothetical protein R3C15_07625 [Thermoleophilia bacterium]
MRNTTFVTRRRLVLGASIAALVGVGVGVSTAGGGNTSSVPGIAAYERARVSSDALPATEVAARVAGALDLAADASRTLVVGPGGRRVVVAPISSGGACLLVIGDTDGNVPGLCSHGTSSVFEQQGEAIAVVVRSEGDPEAPDLIEVAGAVRDGAGVAAVRVDLAGSSRTVAPTADGGFLLELGADALGGAAGVDAVVALDGSGVELAGYTPAP